MKEKLDEIEKEIKEKIEESIYNNDIYVTITIVFEVLHSILDDQAVPPCGLDLQSLNP